MSLTCVYFGSLHVFSKQDIGNVLIEFEKLKNDNNFYATMIHKSWNDIKMFAIIFSSKYLKHLQQICYKNNIALVRGKSLNFGGSVFDIDSFVKDYKVDDVLYLEKLYKKEYKIYTEKAYNKTVKAINVIV